jgi:hypothetical protein
VTFPGEPRAIITDDMVPYPSIGGWVATIEYAYPHPAAPIFRVTPDFIPSRSTWWHEREHHRHAKMIERIGVGVEHEAEFLRELFVTRGADPGWVDRNRALAKEQAASMLPEAFGNLAPHGFPPETLGWGGYQHPCPEVTVPYGRLQTFFHGMSTWASKEEFLAKYISDDLAVSFDAKGNAIVVTPIPSYAGFVSGQKASCYAQRIGLAGSEPFLPAIASSINEDTTKPVGATGRFVIRTVVIGDPVRPGTGFLKISAWQ